jgi:hypothetical protein
MAHQIGANIGEIPPEHSSMDLTIAWCKMCKASQLTQNRCVMCPASSVRYQVTHLMPYQMKEMIQVPALQTFVEQVEVLVVQSGE